MDCTLLDFTVILQTNPNYIVIYDLSDWGLLAPRPAEMYIIPPGFTSGVVMPFRKGEVNNYKASNMGLSCGDVTPGVLNDGLYRLKLRSEDPRYFKTQDYFKTSVLEEALASFISSNPTSDKIVEFAIKREIIQSYASVEDYCKAQEMYTSLEASLKAEKGVPKFQALNICKC